MKKTLFFAYILVAIFLLGCAKEEVTKPMPAAKTYPVRAEVSAMNIEIAGRPFNIEYGKDSWSGGSSASWFSNNGIPTDIKWATSLKKTTGEEGKRLYITFALNTPPMPILDPEDPTFKFPKTHNYQNLLNFFKKGKYPIRAFLPNKVEVKGYDMLLSYVDQANPTKSFGYMTNFGSQEGSKWEIVKVQEVYGDGIYVTYEVDCNIYAEANKPERLVGTIQMEYRIDPNW
jgi:hypothetical protein